LEQEYYKSMDGIHILFPAWGMAPSSTQ
jgi:hypothetical protein